MIWEIRPVTTEFILMEYVLIPTAASLVISAPKLYGEAMRHGAGLRPIVLRIMTSATARILLR